ncbi:MAG TPA: N-acetylmuramoyl-L-alanine amidase, partial [Candidatus Ozemobacteraceae bacterium]|nr:N-acetylmuramoyl-L-alanine amidase [Candidatus Ozemobacteraceae bacterium]
PLDYAGDTGTVYDTTGLEQICMLGSYMNQLPTPEALKALDALVRRDMKALKFTRDQIFAHRELAQTDCPGHELYKWYKDVFKETLP